MIAPRMFVQTGKQLNSNFFDNQKGIIMEVADKNVILNSQGSMGKGMTIFNFVGW